MNDKLSKIPQYLLYLLLGVSVVIGVVYLFSNLDDNNNSIFDTILIYGYILIAVTAVVAILGSVGNLISNPKGAMTTLIGIAGLIVLVIIAYALAGDSLTAKQVTEYKLTAGDSKWVGTGIILTYFALGIAILSIVVTNIMRIFK
ncbi:MAG: hypothetical protein ACEPOW_04350 [Bacteroidales bacterium]